MKRSNWVGVAVAAVILGVLVYFAKKEDTTVVEPEGGVEMFPWEFGAVNHIELKHPRETVKLEIVDGVWKILEPRAVLANPVVVQSIFNAVHPQNQAFRFAKDEPRPDAAIHGLDQPVLVAKLSSKDGKSTTITFGNLTGSDKGERVFVRIGDKPDIYKADAFTFRQFNRTFAELRDLALVRFSTQDMLSATTTMDGKTTGLTKKGRTWVLSGKIEDLAEIQQVDEWAAAAARVEGLQWETRRTMDYGLEAPFAVFDLKATSGNVKLTVGGPSPTAGRRWVESSANPGEVSSMLETDLRFMTLDPESLRSSRAFPIPMQTIDGLGITGPTELLLRRNGQEWAVEKPALITKYHERRAGELLGLLYSAKVTRRMPPADAPAGAATVTWRWGEGDKAETFTAKMWENGKNMAVLTTDPPRLVEVDGLQLWLRVSSGPGALRSPDLFPHMNPLATLEILVETDGLEDRVGFRAVLKGRNWELDPPIPGRQIDGNLMQAFNQLFAVPVVETWTSLRPDDPIVGLKDGARRWKITITPDPAKLTNATPLVLLLGNDGPDYAIYGIVEGTREVFLLHSLACGALRNGVFKK